ncbi:MAG: L,D-transpeptidase [Thermoanaerobaculia bacterium]|nr:L,D-transpeptidase [Thermoanaerobaculia bacterium]
MIRESPQPLVVPPSSVTAPALPAAPPRKRSALWPALLITVALLAAVAGGGAFYLARLGGGYASVPVIDAASQEEAATPKELERRAQKAKAKLATVAPRGAFAVVDTYANRMKIWKGGEMLRDAVVSTGSQTVLRDPRNGRLWVFETPQGERVIERKVKDPIWNKPDWAFIEESQLPPKSSRDRVDDFSLGDYALYIGDGYLLHGTVFQSLLGNPVTHGCVRIGDKDLEYAYNTLPVGGRVFLF